MIAIDPGATGAIVWDDRENGGLRVEKMPETQKDVADMLLEARHDGNMVCYIEKTGGYMPGNSGPAAVKFAKLCERAEMAAVCAGVSLDRVPPQKWMKSLGALPKEKKDRKNAIKAAMQLRFPNIKVTLWNADALAIYCYGIEEFNKRRSDRQKEE